MINPPYEIISGYYKIIIHQKPYKSIFDISITLKNRRCSKAQGQKIIALFLAVR